MINIAFGQNIFLGIVVIFCVTVVYSLRIVRPELARDEDIFYCTLGLIYGCIIIIHGWRLDPILLFSQILLVALIVAAGWENIRLRGILVKKTKDRLEQIIKDFELLKKHYANSR